VPQNERLSVEVVHLQFGAPALPEIVLAAGQKRALSNFVTLTNPSKRALTDVVVIVSCAARHGDDAGCASAHWRPARAKRCRLS
jgi:hypothetical protein